MKMTKLMLATIAVCGASQVMAAGVVRLTGASASSVNVARAAKLLCENAGGTYTLFKTSNSTSALGNQFTGVCAGADFEGTTEDQLRVNVAGGSENAVINATAGGAVTVGFLVPSTSCAVIAGAGAGSLSFMGAGEMRDCGTTLTDNTTSDGGYLDVEGPFFSTTYDAGDFSPAGFSQVFGVAVNQNLYSALQTFQKTVDGGSIVPATCVTNNYTAACQPSISKAQIASLINNATLRGTVASPSAKATGGKFLVGGTDTTKITYCMRPQTSGTQQAAQIYFLNAEADGSFGGKQTIVGEGVTVTAPGAGVQPVRYASVVNPSSSNVRTCLNSTDGYRFGMLSGENNPIGGSDAYRFVKLNEVAFAEGSAGTSQTASAIAGRYDYVFESVAFCPGGTCAAIVDAINGALPAGTSTPGLFLTGVESKYGRGGNSAVPYMFR